MEVGGSGLRVVSDGARLATHVVDSTVQRCASLAPGGSEGDVRYVSGMSRPASAGSTLCDLDGGVAFASFKMRTQSSLEHNTEYKMLVEASHPNALRAFGSLGRSSYRVYSLAHERESFFVLTMETFGL